MSRLPRHVFEVRYRSQRLRRLWDAGFAAGATTYRIELIQMMENAGLKFTDVGPYAEEVHQPVWCRDP